MEGITEKLLEWGTLYGPKVIGALAIFIIGRIVAGILTGVVRRLMLRSKVDAILVGFVTNLTKVGLLTFVVVAALGALGMQTTSVIAVIGAAGLAVGLALQGSLANFASGVMLVIFRPFKTGDYIEAGGTAGVVKEIRIFNTVMKTPDNKLVIVPNSKITGDNVTNYSANEERRLDLVFGISYGDDIRRAKQILEQILKDDSRVLAEPEPVVALLELADSSVNIAVRPWVRTSEYWPVRFDLTERVKLAFDEQGISIPFPQRDVHMHQVTAA